MKQAIADLGKRKIIAIIITILLVAGIPILIVGATHLHENGGFVAMLVIGIVSVVVGFYGTPIAWVQVHSASRRVTLVRAVNEEHLYTVRELAARLNVISKEASLLMGECLRKGYLTGYLREGDRLYLNENTELKPTEYSVECNRCGAYVTYTEKDAKCPYCGCALPITNKKN